MLALKRLQTVDLKMAAILETWVYVSMVYPKAAFKPRSENCNLLEKLTYPFSWCMCFTHCPPTITPELKPPSHFPLKCTLRGILPTHLEKDLEFSPLTDLT